MAGEFDHLGTSLTVPFVRDGKDDFAHATGIEVLDSSLAIIIGTLSAGPQNDGEVPFNQGLGTALKLLRHRNVNDPTTEELASHYTIDGIQRNEPRVRPRSTGFTPEPESNRVRLKLRYDAVERDTTGTNVIQQDIDREFTT